MPEPDVLEVLSGLAETLLELDEISHKYAIAHAELEVAKALARSGLHNSPLRERLKEELAALAGRRIELRGQLAEMRWPQHLTPSSS